MAKLFYERLVNYFGKIGEILRGEADAASIFPNSSDVGGCRENVYVEFLRAHIPSKCNIFLGGFLFGEDGSESKQIDIIISNDTAPRYKVGVGKSFSPVEGCLGVASIKSTLTKKELKNVLENIASIPATKPLGKRLNPQLKCNNYEDWPYKIIYASNGIEGNKVLKFIDDFYKENPNIPISRRPNIIHVAGKYVIFRLRDGAIIKNPDGSTEKHKAGVFHIFTTSPDVQAIMWTIEELQRSSVISTHILFNYSDMLEKIGSVIQENFSQKKQK